MEIRFYPGTRQRPARRPVARARCALIALALAWLGVGWLEPEVEALDRGALENAGGQSSPVLAGEPEAAVNREPVSEPAISWWTVDSGGGFSNGGTYSVNGTAGQTDVGEHNGPGVRLTGGFLGAYRSPVSLVIFADGFETGDASQWSGALGSPSS